jgi:HPt (histidine-containing phosphotransfer) domain-containing protein
VVTGGSGRQAPPPAPPGLRTSAAPGGAPPIDPAVVDSLRRLGQRSGRNVFAELTNLFLSTAETQVATAWALVGEGDYAQLARVAHSLKGSSSVIGGRRVAAAAADLEELAVGGADRSAEEATRAALRHVIAELEQFRVAIEELSRPS